MPTTMKATRQAGDTRFPFTSAQAYATAHPNPEAPISHLPPLAGGNAYGLPASNLAMFGGNSLDGAGQPIMNMGGDSADRRGTALNYQSPYSNPDFEYVYLGSPRTTPHCPDYGFSSAAIDPHILPPAAGDVYMDHHELISAPMATPPPWVHNDNFQAPPHPSERYTSGVMNKAEVPSQDADGLYDIPACELPYDDLWAKFESELQYDVSPDDISMVEPFGCDAEASMPPSVASQQHPGGGATPGNFGDDIVADYKTWTMISDEVGGSSSGQAVFTSTSTKNPSLRRDPQEFPQRQAHYPSEVAQNRDRSLYPLSVDEYGAPETDPRLKLINIVLEESISDRVSTTSPAVDQSRGEGAYTQIPYSYNAQSTPSSSALRDAGGQRASRPENNFRDQAPTNHQMPERRESYDASTGSTYHDPIAMTNNFTQLMAPGLSGIRNLGEPRWAEQLLNLCAAAIASQNTSRAQHLMWVLNDLASVAGDANQRFAAYGLKALFCRVSDRLEAAKTWLRPRHHDQEIHFGPKIVHRALVKFHEYVPWHQNCYTASCQTLLEFCAGKSRLHLIDIGAGKGIEWPIFIDALVGRAGGPPSILRLTMIRDLRREEHNMRTMKSVNSEAADFQTRLVKFANLLGLHVEINMVTKALECVTREDLRLRNGEVLAVVCQFRLHRLIEEVPELPSNNPSPTSRPCLSPRDEFIDFLFSLNPNVLILSENDSDHCPPDFLTRFQNAIGFWWMFYESLEVGYNGRHPEERQILEYEAGMMVLNKVACEGIARIERNEPFTHWVRRVTRSGFVPKDLSDETKKNCQALVQNHSEFWDVAFLEPNMVSLQWRKQPTTFTSVWVMPGSCSKSSCKCSMLHN